MGWILWIKLTYTDAVGKEYHDAAEKQWRTGKEKTKSMAAIFRLISVTYGFARQKALNETIDPINQKHKDGKADYPLKYANWDSEPPDTRRVEPIP